LVLPAYSLAEPYETLTRRHRQRKRMKDELEAELRQLARTTTYAHRLSGFQQWTTLLLESADEEAMRLERVRARLVQVAEVIPLTSALLTAAAQYQRQYGLSPQDALVYAAVLAHLQQHQATQSCFLNRNAKTSMTQTWWMSYANTTVSSSHNLMRATSLC